MGHRRDPEERGSKWPRAEQKWVLRRDVCALACAAVIHVFSSGKNYKLSHVRKDSDLPFIHSKILLIGAHKSYN